MGPFLGGVACSVRAMTAGNNGPGDGEWASDGMLELDGTELIVGSRTSLVPTAEAVETPSEWSLLVLGDGVYATHPLAAGQPATIGRTDGSDVRIDLKSISRHHATLHLEPALAIEDAGSANGTWVRGERLAPNTRTEIAVNEPVRVGTVTVVVQRSSVHTRLRRLRSHEYFESRLEDECARARRVQGQFAVVHVVLASEDADVHARLARCLREVDSVAEYGPRELEALLVDTTPAHAEHVMRQIEAALAPLSGSRIGTAWYPTDGSTAGVLAACARDRARGEARPASPGNGDGVIVADPRMAAIHDVAARVAVADITVLLLGETGVGKEVFAEQIHRRSPRADKPFLRLNCAALTETLLESELFGHERGAFTGAVQTKPGLFEVASGGVLFLDEVGEMPLSTQAKLLRVLDERKVLRVGAVKPRPIDVRVVAATNRDLEAEVRRGAFRLDLLYRLNAMSIVIPPLRERVAEIEPLARRFLAQTVGKNGSGPSGLSDAALAMLRGYRWPGNIRELRNVIQRAAILATGDRIEVADLPAETMHASFVAEVPAPPPAAAPSAPAPAAPAPAAPPPEPDERSKIIAALEACGGNQSEAAKLLGISRRTLINRIERLAVPRPRKR